MTTTITTTQADMLRAAVRAKIAYWDALRAIEIELGDNLSKSQDEALCTAVEYLAAAAFLSCLCGSERLHPRHLVKDLFLSCLCGSELPSPINATAVAFLSCLCGSERSGSPWA